MIPIDKPDPYTLNDESAISRLRNYGTTDSAQYADNLPQPRSPLQSGDFPELFPNPPVTAKDYYPAEDLYRESTFGAPATYGNALLVRDDTNSADKSRGAHRFSVNALYKSQVAGLMTLEVEKDGRSRAKFANGVTWDLDTALIVRIDKSRSLTTIPHEGTNSPAMTILSLNEKDYDNVYYVMVMFTNEDGSLVDLAWIEGFRLYSSLVENVAKTPEKSSSGDKELSSNAKRAFFKGTLELGVTSRN